MDLALKYSPDLQGYDLALAGTDLATDDTFTTAVLVSLMCDRLAAAYEVRAGEDRRGWWADVFSAKDHKTGSRLWLLEREKQLPGVVKRCQHYCEEALAWFIEDGLAKAISVTVFVPRMGWLVAMIKFALNDGARTLRFEFDQGRQVWHLAQEGFSNAV